NRGGRASGAAGESVFRGPVLARFVDPEREPFRESAGVENRQRLPQFGSAPAPAGLRQRVEDHTPADRLDGRQPADDEAVTGDRREGRREAHLGKAGGARRDGGGAEDADADPRL